MGQRGLHAFGDEARKILTRGDACTISELRHFKIDVTMIKALMDLSLQYLVKEPQIDNETGLFINRAGHGDIAAVAMPMKMWIRTRTEHRLILSVTPIVAAISVRGREENATRQRSARHCGLAKERNGEPGRQPPVAAPD